MNAMFDGMPTDVNITTEEVTVYRVHCLGKKKTFRVKQAILGWVAKRYMLPIFDQWHIEYGEYQPGDGQIVLTVWDTWAERKKIFVATIKSNLEKGLETALKIACDELDNYFRYDYV
jgi:hypothetical protein